MKLQYVTGCVCNSLSIDGEEFNEMSLEKRRAICHKLVDDASEYVMQQMFITYMEGHADREATGLCECCGDLIFKYNTEL